MTYLAAFLAALEIVTLAYMPVLHFSSLLALIVVAIVDFASIMYPCDDAECACHTGGLA